MQGLLQKGIALTIAYLIGLTFLTWNRLPQLLTMELNSLGDFLAGAFGPVAFGWLVLSFIQQGHELRESQAAMNAQIESQREMEKIQKQQYQHAISPILKLTGVQGDFVDGNLKVLVQLINSGPSVSEADVQFDGSGVPVQRLGEIHTNVERNIELIVPNPGSGDGRICSIHYRLFDGNWLETKFNMVFTPYEPYVSFERKGRNAT